MKYWLVFPLAASFIAFASVGLGQDPLPPNYVPQLREGYFVSGYSELFQVGEVKGKVKNSAISLPKPEYPKDAISSGAEGIVRVRITIDDQGNVDSAKAETSHELLKLICESTAKRTSFRSFRVNGQAVRTDGEIVYRFEIAKAGWAQAGAGILGFLMEPHLSLVPVVKRLPMDWLEERDLLDNVSTNRKEMQGYVGGMAARSVPAVIFRSMTTATSSAGVATAQVRLPSTAPRPEPDNLAAQQLIDAIRLRLAGDKVALWQFEMGTTLGSMFMTRTNRLVPRSEIARMFRTIIASAPSGISTETLSILESTAVLFEEKETFETGEKIRRGVDRVISSN
ncbi:MAG: TonB family protein [Pyrinomonadaceae bacterium]